MSINWQLSTDMCARPCAARPPVSKAWLPRKVLLLMDTLLVCSRRMASLAVLTF